MLFNIAVDQSHEHNNSIVKGNGDAIGLTKDPSVLRRWMVVGPEVRRLLDEFERSSDLNHSTTDERHHEPSTKRKKSSKRFKHYLK